MLNKQKGNMYGFVTHTWNTVKGKCPHDCSYCYMKRFKQPELHFDESELKTNLGTGNFIFVGSSCDMFADEIPNEWIEKTLIHSCQFDNKYLFQTKYPANIRRILPLFSTVCVTIETNRHYVAIMRNSTSPKTRAKDSTLIRQPLYITIEPIMDFDLIPFVEMIKLCEPAQVNIGANTMRKVKLPEPEPEKVLELISGLEKFTKVYKKDNLKRILNKK